MKRILLLLALTLSCFSSKAQLNLVHNGSFEQYSHCPDNFDQIRYANYWDAIDTNYVYMDSAFLATGDQYAEYINACSSSYACSEPYNVKFHHYPHTGTGMVQAVLYYDMNDTTFKAWNYIQGRLLTHLVAGQSYCVTFYELMDRASGYAINKIGAYLDDGSIDTTHNPAVPQTQYTPQVLDTNVINDSVNWTKIQGSFVANGAEKFITIGNFFDTSHDSHIYLGFFLGAYLTDDVSVIASNAVADAGADTTIHQGDTATIGPLVNADGLPYVWYIPGSTSPIDSGGNIKVHPSATTSYIAEMDLCGTITRDTVKVTVLPNGFSELTSQSVNRAIWPNPSSGAITITHAAHSEVVFYDLTGRAVLRALLASDKEVLDIGSLDRGVYIVRITDAATGVQVVRKVVKE